jgi:hypothetical protein
VPHFLVQGFSIDSTPQPATDSVFLRAIARAGRYAEILRVKSRCLSGTRYVLNLW